MTPKKVLSYDFGEVALFDNYLVTIMRQGITVIPEYNHELVAIANFHFKGKPFGYITHRKNSYAVDPSVYYQTSKIKNLVAFAVVSSNPIAQQTVAVEKIFLDKPFKLFAEMEEALHWVNEIISMENKNAAKTN